MLRSFVEQLDVDALPIDFARGGVEDATHCLVAINMQLAHKLQHAAAVVVDSEDGWKPAALAAQAQNVELQGVVADLNRNVLDLTQALDRSTLQAAQHSTQVCSCLACVSCVAALVSAAFSPQSTPHHSRPNRRSATCSSSRTTFPWPTPRKRRN